MITVHHTLVSDETATGTYPMGRNGRLRMLLLGLDVAGAFTAWTVALCLAGRGVWEVRVARAFTMAACLAVFVVALHAVFKLYLARVCSVRTVEIGRLAEASILGGAAAIGFNHEVPVASDSAVMASAGVSFLVLLGLRRAYASWLRACRAKGMFCRPICVVGVNDEAQALVHLFEGQPDLGYRVLAVMGDGRAWAARGTQVAALDPGDNVAQAARRLGASGVVIAVSAVAPQELDRMVRQVIADGLHVQVSTGLARVGQQRMRLAPLSHQLLFYVEPPSLSPWQSALKRAIDLVGTSAALLLSAPVLAVAALAVKLNDRGPIIYRQERIGRNGQPFEVFKIRTMVPDAALLVEGLARLNERNGPLFKVKDDPRVTRVGRFLRAAGIDELPQLFNVLRGDMSLVGPRPALPSEVAQFDAELLERTSVRPGITGLWQVEAGDSPSFHAYRRLDLFYVDNWSVAMDLTIIAATAGLLVHRATRTFGSSKSRAVGDRHNPSAAGLGATAKVPGEGTPSHARFLEDQRDGIVSLEALQTRSVPAKEL